MIWTTFQKTCFTSWPIIPKHYINCGDSSEMIKGMHGHISWVDCDRDNMFKFWYMGTSRFQKQFPNKISKFHVFFNDLKFGKRVHTPMPNDVLTRCPANLC